MPFQSPLCACGPFKVDGIWLLPLPHTHTFNGTLKERDAIRKVEEGLARRGSDGRIYCNCCFRAITRHHLLDIIDSKVGRGAADVLDPSKGHV